MQTISANNTVLPIHAANENCSIKERFLMQKAEEIILEMMANRPVDPVIDLWNSLQSAVKEYDIACEQAHTVFEQLPEDAKKICIQYGRVIKDRKNGEEIYDPLYAYSEEDIVDKTNEFISSLERMWGGTDGWESQKSARLEHQKHLVAAFREKQTAAQLIRDEMGYTDALERMGKAEENLNKIEEDFDSTVASSIEGILLQQRELSNYLEDFVVGERSKRLFASIEAGLRKFG